MKVIIKDFYYAGMYFDIVEMDLPEIGDNYNETMDGTINRKVKEELDKLLFGETERRG